MTKPIRAISPHGGTLIDRTLRGTLREAAIERAAHLPRLTLSAVNLSDLELIATGAYSPLYGFLLEADYRRVVAEMRLADGTLWPVPITLPASDDVAETLCEGQLIALHSPGGQLVGALDLRERYYYDAQHEAQQVYRTTDPAHPGVARVLGQPSALLGGAHRHAPGCRSPRQFERRLRGRARRGRHPRCARPPAGRHFPAASGGPPTMACRAARTPARAA